MLPCPTLPVSLAALLMVFEPCFTAPTCRHAEHAPRIALVTLGGRARIRPRRPRPVAPGTTAAVAGQRGAPTPGIPLPSQA